VERILCTVDDCSRASTDSSVLILLNVRCRLFLSFFGRDLNDIQGVNVNVSNTDFLVTLYSVSGRLQKEINVKVRRL
jgi:hypothetical protein